jgi:hypothetical protein
MAPEQHARARFETQAIVSSSRYPNLMALELESP